MINIKAHAKIFACHPSSLFVISKKNRLYNRALRREINVWCSNKNEVDLDSIEYLKQSICFKDKKVEISKNRDWLDFIGLLGNFDKGLILGGGNAKFETYLLNTAIVKKFENLDIIFNKVQIDKESNLFADLNFVTLEENSYDIIIAKSILHHIINLEHLLTQVNRALKHDGYFIVLEYIGESKQQWKDDKIIFLNSLLENFGLEISKGVYDNSVPFESIRSEEIPGILDQVFNGTKVTEQKWDYIYSSAKLGLYHTRLRKKKIPNQDFNKEIESKIINYEEEAKKGGLLPTVLFGLYKKNMHAINLEVKKWDKNKIKKEFELNFENLPYNLYKRIKIIIKDYYSYIVMSLQRN